MVAVTYGHSLRHRRPHGPPRGCPVRALPAPLLPLGTLPPGAPPPPAGYPGSPAPPALRQRRRLPRSASRRPVRAARLLPPHHHRLRLAALPRVAGGLRAAVRVLARIPAAPRGLRPGAREGRVDGLLGGLDKSGTAGSNPLARQLFGEVLVGLYGKKWARHRRVIAPAFNMERVKVNMVLKETLRLYATAVFLNRRITRDIKLGNLNLPGGIHLDIPILDIHHDIDIWGSNADVFDPSRFEDGKSYHLGAYLPFGVGPTICVGQNLVMVEAKLALAIMLQQFAFVVSPSYIHAPMQALTVQPQYGAQILVHKI